MPPDNLRHHTYAEGRHSSCRIPDMLPMVVLVFFLPFLLFLVFSLFPFPRDTMHLYIQDTVKVIQIPTISWENCGSTA